MTSRMLLESAIDMVGCVAAWWLVFTLFAYPVCRARRINRTVARLLEGVP